MRKLPSATLAATLAATAMALAVSFSGPVLADAADPTVHQIYDAAEAGHFDQAQQMMDQVLRDHPKSAKAHYVQAELYAKEGKVPLARAELTQAEEYDPGLTHENPRSVQALKTQLGLSPRTTQGSRVIGMTSAPAAAHFPWGTVLVLVLAVGALWMLFRRRSSYSQYPAAPVMGSGPGTYGGPGGGYAGPGGPMGGGGGVGSGIAGGLASGLAVGAGVVAGEELAHHFLDGGRREGGVIPPASAADSDWQQPSNGDMGGSDFGVNDPGSWDDSGGGGGGGGGDDWS
ncbi:MAG TPA: tetratricopeptide repeat protein [Steroidobacteraceae bacterium]|nr:tetratricopeptide repeat protein [Steroidobacteraceae bacterium]